MNKFRFKLRNYLLMLRFNRDYKKEKVEYPGIIDHLSKSYGQIILVEDFKSLDNWKVTDKTDWGSARPDNLCTLVKENVSLQDDGGRKKVVISTTPEAAIGKGWNGEEISRPFSSGMMTSKFTVAPGQVISATVNTSDSYAGSWFAFWLFKKDMPGDERYREVDIFEKFMERKGQKQYKISVHGGSKTDREMLTFEYLLFYVNEDKMTFVCELHPKKVRVFINGIQIFLAEEPGFDGEYHVIFNDAPTTHEGKVGLEEIQKALPRKFEVIDFRVFDL
jgi:hypothetical protein